MAVASRITVRVEADQTNALDMTTAFARHDWPQGITHPKQFASGTAASTADLIFTDQRTAAASADDLDLAGSLTDAFGNTLTFVELVFIGVYNRSTTSTEALNIGGGSNPITSIWGASGDIATCGPSSHFVWSDWVDGAPVTAGTADILRIDPGSATITYDIVIIGRSA